jgi:restriction system protein
MARWQEILKSEIAGRPVPEKEKRPVKDAILAAFGPRGLAYFAPEPFPGGDDKYGRPIVDEGKKRRRPTQVPLVAIGMDRRVQVPTEALARYRRRHQPSISVSTILVPDRNTDEGLLIKGTTIAWAQIAEMLKGNWTEAFSIPPEKWEEMIAGAYERAGYDQVTLTPRSGDFGRDVIAVKSGIGCIKVIGSVKAYSPGHLVKHDDVRAFLGVLGGERDASKGIITTTSDFAPRIASDPFIKPYLSTRLELMNGERLQMWLTSLLQQSKRPF